MDIKKTITCILIRPKYSPINTSEKELEMAKVAEKLHQWAEELFGYTDKVHIIDIQNKNTNSWFGYKVPQARIYQRRPIRNNL